MVWFCSLRNIFIFPFKLIRSHLAHKLIEESETNSQWVRVWVRFEELLSVFAAQNSCPLQRID
ncbi:hypothetical protein AA21952_2351 [Acetobacter oeni LMG 21952]|nr:hypothetical protein AA21952_2351 [Acetobacter oeni LMG 21952]